MAEKKTEKTAPAKPDFDMKTYNNELVSVKLFKDNDKYKDDVFVAVNGVGMIVPRGIEVKIPRKYAEALYNSQQQSSFALDYQMKLQNQSVNNEKAI